MSLARVYRGVSFCGSKTGVSNHKSLFDVDSIQDVTKCHEFRAFLLSSLHFPFS